MHPITKTPNNISFLKNLRLYAKVKKSTFYINGWWFDSRWRLPDIITTCFHPILCHFCILINCSICGTVDFDAKVFIQKRSYKKSLNHLKCWQKGPVWVENTGIEDYAPFKHVLV